MRDFTNAGNIHVNGDMNVGDGNSNGTEYRLYTECDNETLRLERPYRQENDRLEQGRKLKRLSPFFAITSNEQRAEALRIAIVAADRQNRYRAMDTCSAMICSVSNEELAQHVADVLMQERASFTGDIDPTTCRSAVISHVIGTLKQNQLSAVQPVFNFLNS